jgi:hypothetical protein
MKKLVLKSFAMLFLMASCFIILWIMPGMYTHDLAALVNKKEMLEAKKPPRIIFMGGSSLLTLDSRAIERATGRSVANMGLWGGLSIARYLDEIKNDLRSGDTVVITQEYSTVLDSKYVEFINTNEESKKFLLLLSPQRHLARYCHEGSPFEAFKLMMQLVQMKSKSFFQNLVTLNWNSLFRNGYIYYDEEFDRNGDRVRPFKVLRPLDSTGIIFSPHDMGNHRFLNEFYRFASNRNVKVLFYFSHFPAEEYRLNEKTINALHRDLRHSLEFPIINAPADFVFPRDYFADTVYHLNTKGEAVRTRKLIQYLLKYL